MRTVNAITLVYITNTMHELKILPVIGSATTQRNNVVERDAITGKACWREWRMLELASRIRTPKLDDLTQID